VKGGNEASIIAQGRAGAPTKALILPLISSTTCFIFHLCPGFSPAGKPEELISANR
jgi:hypothetical protein